jgi:single-strand DNA-binding protein
MADVEHEGRRRGRGLNHVTLVGHLAADPEIRLVGAGEPLAVTEFRLITNDRQEPEAHELVAYRRVAEVVARYCRTGHLILVVGHLHRQKWFAADGSPRARVLVIAENVQFLARPADAADDAEDDG